MKKLTIFFATIGLMAAFQSQASLNFHLDGFADGGGGEGGGPFNATLTGDAPIFNGVALHGSGKSYTTFCIEFNEHISVGGNYNAVLNSGGKSGGVSGGGTSHFDQISVGTAWLYRQWVNGNSYLLSHGADVQRAIWFLEDEKSSQSYLSTGISSMLAAALGSNFKQDSSVGYLGVYVLNLTDSNGNVMQDQLVSTPVPEANTVIAGALLLLPFGVSAFRALRRNKSA